jgi:hypothetical protein
MDGLKDVEIEGSIFGPGYSDTDLSRKQLIKLSNFSYVRK